MTIKVYASIHSHKKRKDSWKGSLDQVLFAAELEISGNSCDDHNFRSIV